MHPQTPPLACTSCGNPLPAARIKSPAGHGWLCTGCYHAVYVLKIDQDILLSGAHYYEVVHSVE